MQKLVSLTSDICISVEASRDLEKHNAAMAQKGTAETPNTLRKISNLTSKALIFLLFSN